MIRRLVIATLPWFLFAIPVRALDPNLPASSFVRTHFGAEEGVGTVVDEILQTPDGFLWVITNSVNLQRFDGRTFHPFPGLRPWSMALAPNGDFWVGARGALIRIPSSSRKQLEQTGWQTYQPGPGTASDIIRVRFTRGGVLWVGTGRGLFRYDGNRFVAVGPPVTTYDINEAPDGHLLVRNTRGFLELAGSEEVPHPGLAARLGVPDKDIFHVLKDRQGNTWYCTTHGVARERGGRIEKLGTYGPNGHGAFRAHEDAKGTVWIGKDDGLFRATQAGLEVVAPGLKVRSLYSDRDDNLWVGTNGDGLYRFKEPAARMFTPADGLPGDVIQTVLAARDGSVWTGANCGGISRFDGTRFKTLAEKDGLLNSCVWALTEDADGGLWIGTWGGGAFRYHNGVFTQYSEEQGELRDDRVTSIVVARDGAVWFGTRAGATRLRDGRFRTFRKEDGLAVNSILRLFEDRNGGIWAGTRSGLHRLVGDRFEHLASLPATMLLPIGEDEDGRVLVGHDAEGTTLRLDRGRTETVAELPAPTAMVRTGQGESWFGGADIHRVPPGGLTRSRAHDEPLDREAFSAADGLATPETSMSGRGMAVTADGRLWVATPKGLAMFDLRRLPGTSAKPWIYLTDVTIGRNRQRAGREIVLPPGTSHVNIEFAAVEITSPEKIRMQYRLDGVDSEWLDAAADPHAIYTRIPVGTHALRIRACNRSGIWDRQGVAFRVTQLPHFYQTRWFLAAMIALGLLLVGFIYRLRVRQLSHRMSALFDERLAERTRVAREIHDTFLQTVQGSKLVADHALRDPADHARMVRAMEQLSAWLGQATEEGRAALNSLRASTTEKNDLAEALRRAIDECRAATDAEISLSVHGNPREMHPVVRDEIYRIAYEAIRNACTHSGGTRVEVTLDYGHDLTLRIHDNGVGIDAGIVETGRESHFGLRGMRERAERINSTFTLVSSRDSGTAVTLAVPGRVAYRKL